MQSRQIYKVCKLPGECSWAALPQQNVSIDAIGEPKMEHEYVKLYIYDESPKPEANAIIELCGIFYAKRDPNIVPVRDSAVKYIQFVISFLLTNLTFVLIVPQSPFDAILGS